MARPLSLSARRSAKYTTAPLSRNPNPTVSKNSATNVVFGGGMFLVKGDDFNRIRGCNSPCSNPSSLDVGTIINDSFPVTTPLISILCHFEDVIIKI